MNKGGPRQGAIERRPTGSGTTVNSSEPCPGRVGFRTAKSEAAFRGFDRYAALLGEICLIVGVHAERPMLA